MLSLLSVAFGSGGPTWNPLDADALEQARRSHKLVFLDVEAVWCHWCHVMDATTYQDPRIQRALAKHFVTVRVDQDARPDISRRYHDYGWPALVVLDPVTLEDRAIGSGYHDVDELLALLKAGRKGTPVVRAPIAAGGTLLDDAQRAMLHRVLVRNYDPVQAGWGRRHKFVPWRNLDWALRSDDPELTVQAQRTLDAGRALIDPVWGGVYQYSTHGDWVHGHFEKIMRFESEIGAVYARAYQKWGRPEDLASARAIVRHITTWLADDSGAFHPSQDADLKPGEHSAAYFELGDEARRARGTPRVDPHLYAGETGLAVGVLVALWRATGEPEPLAQAERAGAWLLAERLRPDGAFARDAGDEATYLADQIEVGRGMMGLFAATGDRRWLVATIGALDRVQALLAAPDAGYVAGPTLADSPPPIRDRDENLKLARLANLVRHAAGEARFGELANHAMRFVTSETQLDAFGWHVGGVLSADAELAAAPPHVVIVGDPAQTGPLFDLTRKLGPYAVVERLAPGEPGANGVEYPDLGEPAAFFCAEGRCSPPITDPAVLERRLNPS